MQSTYNHTYVNSLVCDGHFVTGVLLSDVVREKPGLVRCDSSPVWWSTFAAISAHVHGCFCTVA